MFTGIVTDIGIVEDVGRDADRRIRVATRRPQRGLEIGSSIACNGICLTLVEKCAGNSWFEVNVSRETLDRTTAGSWKPGDELNLESSLRVGDELGGHIVTGHVDAVTEIKTMEPVGGSCRLKCLAPLPLARFLAEKGSVALNGVSLTVNDVTDSDFTVNLIPHTIAATTWKNASPGDQVNIEVDVLARYISRFQDAAGRA